jgi:predicted O-methyltransferase YrrM
MNGVLPDRIEQYLTDRVPPRAEELRTMELHAAEISFPIIGPACGHFSYLVARMIGAQRVFEMGSGYGYSTAWFARAVHENGGGEVYHVVWDADLSAQAQGHLAALGYADDLKYVVGEAVETLKAAPGLFDLIFLDIEKEGYPEALPLIASKLRPGGVLLADNMLRRGRVADPADQSAPTAAIRLFTRMVTDNPAWLASIIPIRDGLLLAWKQA